MRLVDCILVIRHHHINGAQMNSQSDDVVTLFSGAGGFSYGFSSAGIKPICGAELNKDACNSYEENIGSTCFNIDLSKTPPCFFKDILGGKEPFALIGGPPCQGFSTAGSRNSTDPRNQLIFNYLQIVSEVRPRWFIFENVEGLLTSGNGEAVSSLVREFLRIGYSVRVEKVNLASFGVPQTRKRVLIIGNRIGADFVFPEENYSYNSGKSKKKSNKPFAPTLLEAIGGLGQATNKRSDLSTYSTLEPANAYDALMRSDNSKISVTEHFDNTSPEDAERYSLLKAGQTMKDLPEEYWHESFRRRAFRRVQDGTPTEKRGGAPSGIKRLHGDLQSLTITGAAYREFINPTINRPLTIRECARLQSFPDNYKFFGNAASVMQQIGNAVPPIAAAVFARHLQNIDGLHGSGTVKIKKISVPTLLGYRLTESNGMSEALKKTDSLLNDFIQHGLELT